MFAGSQQQVADLVRNGTAQQCGILYAASPRDGSHLLVKDSCHLARQRDRVDDGNAELKAASRERAQLKRASFE